MNVIRHGLQVDWGCQELLRCKGAPQGHLHSAPRNASYVCACSCMLILCKALCSNSYPARHVLCPRR